MFTIDQIRKAHVRVKSGADFPQYVRDLEALGVASYENYVSDGRTTFYGAAGFTLMSDPKYPAIDVSPFASETELRDALRIHQQGHTDYPTFCRQAAVAGVAKWKVTITEKTCTYYNIAGEVMLVEMIP